MKKTYITPAFFAVELGIRRKFMLTASDDRGSVITYGGEGNGGDIGAKEMKDVNVWDEEW